MAVNLSASERKWLGGADPTDPYILARMNASGGNNTSAVQNSLNSALSTARTTVGTVSQNIGSAANNFTNNISSITGVSSQKVNSTLLGGAVGGLLGGGRGAAIGALAGGILGDGGPNNLIGQVQNKLQGIISEAEELTGLLSNPLKIIERGIADLSGITGEENSLIQSQYRELSQSTSFGNFVDNGYRSPYQGDDTSASRIPNPLRNHNGFNYKITLGVLDAAEYNNPELYRAAAGFKNYVIQSSGGDLSKRYQVFDEIGSGASQHAEYYIEDINLEAVVAPNANTRVTMGTSLSFTVIEPYSMGNFIQAVIGSAADAGFISYNQAPFCLRIDFVGWNLDGSTNANFIQRPIFVPIQLINMDFNVSGQGSKYEVKAVPMSETGLSDNINKIKTPIRATGLRCHEVLETNDASVTSGINSQIEALEKSGALSPYDRYIVAFPKNRGTLQTALQVGTIDETAFTTSSEEREQQRVAAGTENPQLRSAFSPTVITVTQTSQTYAILKSFAENVSLMNEIGLSTLNEDTNAPGNSSEADASQVTNPETGLVDTQSIAAQPADKARDFQFNQDQQITSIIERVVMQTTYAAERSTEGATNGMNKWFKIDTQVFIDEGAVTEAQMGRRPKVYVYSVVPYEVPEAVTIGPQQRASNARGLNKLAAKEYNYIYTGKNEDVLSFDINFNNAFMTTAFSDFGMTTAAIRNTDAGATATTQTNSDSGAQVPVGSDAKSLDDQTGGTQTDTTMAETSGTYSNDIRRKIAETFHDRITNMTVDMVTAEMEIMGDPFFLPQETGNYVAQRSSENPSVTTDGTMAYQDGPVLVAINFKTPFDYQIKGATMEFPQIVPGFSGTFQVWGVTNNFASGKFTQTLKMFRLRGQDDPATTGPTNFIQNNNSVAVAPTTVQSDGTVGQSGVPNSDCMPAPQHDDVRALMPAVAADVAARLAAPFVQIEQQRTGAIPNLETLVKGVDFGVADVPDLTKVISRVTSAGKATGNALIGNLGAALGSYTNGIGGLSGGIDSAINSLGDPNAPPYTGDDPIIRARLGLPPVNTTNRDIAAVTGSSTAKVRNLLG